MKKLNISILLILAALIGINFLSCKKDAFTEEDAMKLQDQLTKNQKLNDDSLATKKVRVMYTINLVDASKSTLKSTNSVSAMRGAVIKLSQNDQLLVKTVDTSGIAVFDSLKTGYATVNIYLADYSEVNYVVNFAGQVGTGINGGLQLANIIPMIPVSGTATATISGRVTCESDLTNRTPEIVPEGTRLVAIARTNSAALPGIGGIITSISYDNLSLSTTTDAFGNYSLTVPATLSGLDYDIRVSDFQINQSLLMLTYNGRDTSGVVSVSTNFGSSITAGATTIPAVNSVIVTVDPPTYNYVTAVAAAVLDNDNGIDNIQITDNGDYYPANTTLNVILDNPTDPATSRGSAQFVTNAFGRVKSISVTATGSDYPASAEGAAFTIPYVKEEAVLTITSVNGTGAITGISVTNGGRYYISDPNLLVFSFNGAAGTGAVITASLSYNFGGYYTVSNPQVAAANTGAGYVASATYNVKVATSLNKPMTGLLHLTSGTVSAINISNQGTNYVSGKTVIVIDAPGGTGTTATASATVSNGKITAISVTNGGSGYSSTPGVTILNQVERVQAKYTANVNANGNITGFTQVSAGNGYISVPAVTITPSISGLGSAASARAIVSNGQVTSLTLINGGNGYISSNYPAASQNASNVSSNVKGNANMIVNIHLGTGKRTIEQ